MPHWAIDDTYVVHQYVALSLLKIVLACMHVGVVMITTMDCLATDICNCACKHALLVCVCLNA